LDRLWHETGYEDMGIGFKHEPTDPRTDGIPYDLSKPIAPSDDMGGLVDVITSEQQAIAEEADWQAKAKTDGRGPYVKMREQLAEEENSYVAYLYFTHPISGEPVLHIGDSDTPGAFKVFRRRM
jgi:hypothetical protein